MMHPLLSLLIATGLALSAAVPAAGCPSPALPDTLSHGLLVDDTDERQVEITAYWATITEEACGAFNEGALYDGGVRADGVVRFRPALVKDGLYDVYMYWPALEEHELATNAPVTVRHEDGSHAGTLNLREHANQWVHLGTFPMRPDANHYAEIRNDAVDGTVVADAVVFVPAGDTSHE